MKTKILTDHDITHLSQLANLTLSEEEKNKLKNQFNETLSYVENLNELDTSKVQPTNNASNQVDVFFDDGENNKRQFTQEEAVANAKHTKNGYFVVGRIMD